MSDEAFNMVFGQLSQPKSSNASVGPLQRYRILLSDHEAMKALFLQLRCGDELGSSICMADLGAQGPPLNLSRSIQGIPFDLRHSISMILWCELAPSRISLTLNAFSLTEKPSNVRRYFESGAED